MRMLCPLSETGLRPHEVPLPTAACTWALEDENLQRWWRPHFKSGKTEALKADYQSQDRRPHPWDPELCWTSVQSLSFSAV